MNICECGLAMQRDTSSGVVKFVCYCGKEAKGKPEDARIGGGVLHSGETEEKYRRLIRSAAFDRVNQKVKRDCPGKNCGRDYMTQVRVGPREVVVWVCKCGYRATREGMRKK
jgi:hypothetical protein